MRFWVFLVDLRAEGALSLRAICGVSVIGGLIGAGLLIVAPATAFATVLPWLLLLAQ
jgi:hypothetical protein